MSEHSHKPCPFCGSSDAFSHNDETGLFRCFSCGATPRNKSGLCYDGQNLEPFTSKDIKPLGEYEDFRGIKASTMEKYNVTTTDTEQHYPYPSGGIKVRKFPKEFHTKNFKSDELFGMNLFNAGGKFVTITEGECFTPNAEVFTPSGWVSLEDYSGQPVLQVFPDQSAGFTNPKAVVDKQFEGDLIEYKSGSYYSLTTPDHNIVRLHPKEGLKKFKADKNSYFNVPRTFTRRDTHAELSLLDLQIWIMLSADFTFRESGDIYGALKKDRKVERAKYLLDRSGVRYSLNKDSRGYYSVFIHRGHNFWFAQKDLPFCLSWHPEKRELLEEVIFWDGNFVNGRDQAEFSSVRKHNIDVVQMLAHSCGYVSTIIYRSNRYGNWIKVSILFDKSTSSTQKGYKTVPYKGRVMCLTVETGMLVVRQRGSISISGNCDAMSAYQMLKKSGYEAPVVSVPSATPSPKLWEKCKDWLNSFETIKLSVDNDKAGDELAQKISQIFPGKVYRLNHGDLKDANEFLQQGKVKSYQDLWWKAERIKPDAILCTEDDFNRLYEETPNHEYFKTGIPELDERILGIHKGYFTVIGGITGRGKCLGPDVPVMLYNGDLKLAKDVKVGDQLMGDDSTPRNVLGTTKGQEEMFRIVPTKGEPWECNKSHMLSLVHTSKGYKFEISVGDYLKQNSSFKHAHKLYRAPVKNFGEREVKNVYWHPYLVGVYLGDGHKHRAGITLGYEKNKVINFVEKCLKSTGHKTRKEDKGSCIELTFTRGGFYRWMKHQLEDFRHVPEEYLYLDEAGRAFVLAGLLDTDGSVKSGSCAEITQKSKVLAYDIAFLARSLGLAAYVKEKKASIKSLDFEGTYYRVTINGDMRFLPTQRLEFTERKQVKDVLRTGFTVEPLGMGEYAGFQVDGNHRFLLWDFTVTHNSEFMRYLEYTAITQTDYKIAILHLEETQLRSLLGLVSYDLGTNVTRKDLIEERGLEHEVKQSLAKFAEGEQLHEFSLATDETHYDLIDRIRYLVAAMGVDYIFFEPIQDVVSGNTSEKESLLSDLANTLSRLAPEINVGIVTIGHLNDDMEFKYCRTIGQKAAFEILLERDIETDDPVEANRTYIRVGRKNRVGGGSGPAGAVDFDKESYMLEPVKPMSEPYTASDDNLDNNGDEIDF